MNQHELPVGFGMALAQNSSAMKTFADLPKFKQEEVLQKAHAVASKEEMQSLVDGLTAQF